VPLHKISYTPPTFRPPPIFVTDLAPQKKKNILHTTCNYVYNLSTCDVPHDSSPTLIRLREVKCISAATAPFYILQKIYIYIYITLK